MMTRIVAFVLGVAALVFGALSFWPELFSLQRTYPFAFAVASRGASALVALIAVVVLLILGILGKRARKILRPVILWLLVFVAASALVLYNRGWSNVAVDEAKPNQITVFTWNTMGNKPGVKTIAAQALKAKADVVSLPETTLSAGQAINRIMTAAGRPMQVLHIAFDDVYKAHSTVLLVSTSLGSYTVDRRFGNTNESPSIVAAPSRSGSPVLVAAHAIAPTASDLNLWRKDLNWLSKRCSVPNVIMAGDFNASVDNTAGLGPAVMGNCGDVALKLGAASSGTWPANMPSLLGTQIDHVFYSSEWKPIGITIDPSFTEKWSDHRPVVATLVPVAN
jgi:endonuclease/exonuclease/phosphatase (EEP) superfamily protein YafD